MCSLVEVVLKNHGEQITKTSRAFHVSQSQKQAVDIHILDTRSDLLQVPCDAKSRRILSCLKG